MRRHGPWCAFLVAYCAAYAYALASDLSLPGYWPVERVWQWGEGGGGPAMGWYARVLWAGLVGLAAGGLARGLGRVFTGYGAILGWVVLGFVLAALGFTAHRELTHWGVW